MLVAVDCRFAGTTIDWSEAPCPFPYVDSASATRWWEIPATVAGVLGPPIRAMSAGVGAKRDKTLRLRAREAAPRQWEVVEFNKGARLGSYLVTPTRADDNERPVLFGTV